MRQVVTVISLLLALGAEARADGVVPICQDGEIPWFTAMPEQAPDQLIADDGDAESPFRCRGDLLLGDARCWPDLPAGSVPHTVSLFGGGDQFVTADQQPPPLHPATRLAFVRQATRKAHPGYARGLERPPRHL